MFSAGSVVSMTEDGAGHARLDEPVGARLATSRRPTACSSGRSRGTPTSPGCCSAARSSSTSALLDPALLNADYDFEWRIASRFPYVVSSEPCVVSVVHDTQATRTSDAAAWLLSYHTMRGHLDSNDESRRTCACRAQALLAGTFADAMPWSG